MSKYIFCLGSIYSGCGKGVAAASIGMLLKARGHSVTMLKCDGYLNTTASVLSPDEHGESWVTFDGKECDLDLGHYERLCGIETNKDTIFTSGLLYKELIEEHENGVYLGKTIQLQHLTNKVKERFEKCGKDHDVTIVEIGGVIGDVEAYTYLEAVRQFQQKYKEDVMVVVVAPVIWVSTIKEFKTKPLQNGIKELQKAGIHPDILLCRANRPVPEKILKKISDLTSIDRSAIFPACDVESIYQVPIEFYNNQLDDFIVDMLRLPRSYCRISKYKEIVEKLITNGFKEINIAIVYKYENMDEAYLSLKESLVHAGVANDIKVKIQWVKSEDLEKPNKLLEDADGIIVPGGFGDRGISGKIAAIKYARENKIPFLGICLGLQCSVIEFAKNVCKIKDANSMEFEKTTPNPVVYYIEGQENIKKKSGTLRLGAYDCDLEKDSLAFDLYKKKAISERHRHRLEVNPKYLDEYKAKGFKVTGINPGSNLVEIMELDREIHPYFIATQAHPEFKSRLIEPHPLFKGLVAAAITYNAKKNTKGE